MRLFLSGKRGKIKFLDLFAGIGGFRLGMEAQGHKCLVFCEIDKFARTSYKAMFNKEGEIEYHDIKEFTDHYFRQFRGQEEANQNKAINQVYKDYMLDYRFESDSIYVNTESNVSLAEVTYQGTYVSDLSEQQQRISQTEAKTVMLSYSKVSDKLPVNQLTIWNGKLEDMKEAIDEANSNIPTIQRTTTSENN